ncbi:MAG: SDR family oxidoreductase [Magnetococcales bacterium]|nr:SDR family oxidoreductase [Magnetococcales bacterium]
MTEVHFEVRVTFEEAQRFAALSGDHNPLHTDPDYAAGTTFGRPILHGAFSAALFSRMAGMHLPGRACLLHGMRLRFVAPILPPTTLRVTGTLLHASPEAGEVTVAIDDISTGIRCVEGSYRYGYHQQRESAPVLDAPPPAPTRHDPAAPVILITGSSGGLGSALRTLVGESALPWSRNPSDTDLLQGRPVAGIIHCGWPAPDNQRLIQLGSATHAAVQHQVAAPLEQMITLAQTLATHGLPGAPLILVGSTLAEPGWHHYRMPLYSLGKSLIPTLTRILALELGAKGQKCLGVVFDIIEGPGMNASTSKAIRLKHADRSPFGQLITTGEAAAQLHWLLNNPSIFTSGATLTLSGGMVP